MNAHENTVDAVVLAGMAEYLARQADFPKWVETKYLAELRDEDVLAVELLRMRGDDLICRLFAWNHFGDGREWFQRLNTIADMVHRDDPFWPAPPEGQRSA